MDKRIFLAFLALLAVFAWASAVTSTSALRYPECEKHWDRADDETKGLIGYYAKAYAVDPQMLFTLACVESGFNNRARSSAGAVGVMQVMPKDNTAGESCKEAGIISEYNDLKDKELNIECGAWYFSTLLRQCSSLPNAVRAYHSGKCYGSGKATLAYVKKYMWAYGAYDFSDEEDIGPKETGLQISRDTSLPRETSPSRPRNRNA